MPIAKLSAALEWPIQKSPGAVGCDAALERWGNKHNPRCRGNLCQHPLKPRGCRRAVARLRLLDETTRDQLVPALYGETELRGERGGENAVVSVERFSGCRIARPRTASCRILKLMGPADQKNGESSVAIAEARSRGEGERGMMRSKRKSLRSSRYPNPRLWQAPSDCFGASIRHAGELYDQCSRCE